MGRIVALLHCWPLLSIERNTSRSFHTTYNNSRLEINLKSKDRQKRANQTEQREIVCAAQSIISNNPEKLTFPLRCSLSSGVKCQPVVVWWGQGGIALIKARGKFQTGSVRLHSTLMFFTMCTKKQEAFIFFTRYNLPLLLLSRKISCHSRARPFPRCVESDI